MNQIQPSKKKFNGTVLVLMALFGIVTVAVIVLFTRLTTASALPGDLTNAEKRYPAIVGSRVDPCSLCHLGSPPALNAYGADYKSHGRNAAALTAIERLDSDGDGFTNLQEIRGLTYPGNANDFAAAAKSKSSSGAIANAYPPPETATLPPYPPPSTSVPTLAPTATSTQTSTTAPTRTNAPTRTSTSTAAPTRTSTNTAAPTRTSTNTAAPTRTSTNTVVPTQALTNTAAPTRTSTNSVAPTQAPTNTAAPTQAPTSTPVPTKAPTKTVAPTQEPTHTLVPTQAATKSRLRATRTPTTAATRRVTRTPRPTQKPSPTVACNSRDKNSRNRCKTPLPTRTLGPTRTSPCRFDGKLNCYDFNQLLGGFNGVSFGNLDLFFLPLKEQAGALAGGRAGK